MRLKDYLTVFNTVVMSIMLGLSLALLANSSSQFVGWVAFVCALVFSLLTLDSVRLTRKTLFKVRQPGTGKLYGRSFAYSVANFFNPPKPHPLLDYHISIYYEVPAVDGSTEYIERLAFYVWLTRVWKYQNNPDRKAQASPLSQKRWEKELGGTNRYMAYMYILGVTGALDPESSYHVKKLRLPPWNIVILADERLITKQI